MPVFVKNLSDCPSFTANDGCEIQELLHPKNDPIDLPYSLAVATVSPNQSSYRHRLQQTEIYFILSGRGLLHIDDEQREVSTGDAAVIPGGCEQWIDNLSEQALKFIAIVNPPWTAEDDVRT